MSLEIDTPPSVYLTSREYTGQLVERQLHRPLFRENAEVVVSDLVSVHDRIGAHGWVFRVADDSTWCDGESVTATHVAARLAEVALSRKWAWLAALLRRCEVIDTSTIGVTTRRPVAMLDRVLANPAFSPRDLSRSTGAYVLAHTEQNRTRFVSRQDSSSVVDLVTTASREEGRRRFDIGSLDIGWGIGVPPEYWAADDPGPFAPSVALDTHVIVSAGRAVPADAATSVLDACGHAKNLPPGIDATSSRFRKLPAASDPRDQPAASSGWPLYFSPFPPNRELAASLARASGGRLVPTRVSYDVLISDSARQDGFTLQIHTTQFPDALGLQVESALLEQMSRPVTDDLRALASTIWGTGSETARRELAQRAERPLDQLLGRRVVGRLQTRFRSHSPIDIPRTGWFDFRQFAT